MTTQEYDKQDWADHELAYQLLVGIEERDEKGLTQRRYLDKREEIEARKALGRLLRNGKPLDRSLSIILADHFDGEAFKYRTAPLPAIHTMEVNRRLRFVNPSRQVVQTQRRKQIASYVLKARLADPKRTQESVFAEIADNYGISDESVKDAWEEFKTMLDPFGRLSGR